MADTTDPAARGPFDDLIGRRAEAERLMAAMGEAEAGVSRCLVVRGPPGSGKTALLGAAAVVAGTRGHRTVAISGHEADRELAYTALGELAGPFLEQLADMHPARAAALRAALGVSGEALGDRFTTGAATLELLAAASEAQPLTIVVDDVQWIDAASLDVIAFVARRLTGERLLMLLGLRTPGPGPSPLGGVLDGLDRILLGPLDEAASEALITRVAPGTSDAEVARLTALGDGNPLALVELAKDTGTGAGRDRDAGTDEHPAERVFRYRVEALPEATRARPPGRRRRRDRAVRHERAAGALRPRSPCPRGRRGRRPRGLGVLALRAAPPACQQRRPEHRLGHGRAGGAPPPGAPGRRVAGRTCGLAPQRGLARAGRGDGRGARSPRSGQPRSWRPRTGGRRVRPRRRGSAPTRTSRRSASSKRPRPGAEWGTTSMRRSSPTRRSPAPRRWRCRWPPTALARRPAELSGTDRPARRRCSPRSTGWARTTVGSPVRCGSRRRSARSPGSTRRVRSTTLDGHSTSSVRRRAPTPTSPTRSSAPR